MRKMRGVGQLALRSTDPQRVAEFYESAFGFRRLADDEAPLVESLAVLPALLSVEAFRGAAIAETPDFLRSYAPLDVQLAAIAALSTVDDPSAAAVLRGALPELGASAAEAAFEALLARAASARTLLDAVDGGEVLVGADDFARAVIGRVYDVDLPAPGTVVRQGEPAFTLRGAAGPIPMVSPVDGLVVATNPKARVGSVESDPYGEGWLLRVQAPQFKRNARQLLSGSAARSSSRNSRTAGSSSWPTRVAAIRRRSTVAHGTCRSDSDSDAQSSASGAPSSAARGRWSLESRSSWQRTSLQSGGSCARTSFHASTRSLAAPARASAGSALTSVLVPRRRSVPQTRRASRRPKAFLARSTPLPARVTWILSSSPMRPGARGARIAAARGASPSGVNASRASVHEAGKSASISAHCSAARIGRSA